MLAMNKKIYTDIYKNRKPTKSAKKNMAGKNSRTC